MHELNLGKQVTFRVYKPVKQPEEKQALRGTSKILNNLKRDLSMYSLSTKSDFCFCVSLAITLKVNVPFQ